ncbi:hypothetical protein [Microbulbifer sp. SAOS-129_SWC]|uniref:DUF7931 domain-containing protein n=1 Tax=Microbulbifer sp. SAOS-129_SWC TaxID=3145235 RepID=UPI0032169D32
MADSGQSAQALADLEQFRYAMVELLRGASREVDIFSAQLAHALYHDAGVTEALSDFARSSRVARVRLLVRDTEPMVRRFHRVAALFQRLSSRIELRRIEATVDTPDWEFAIADGRQLVVCDDRRQWCGLFERANPARARQLGDAFEREWPLAAADPNLRRLQL